MLYWPSNKLTSIGYWASAICSPCVYNDTDFKLWYKNKIPKLNTTTLILKQISHDLAVDFCLLPCADGKITMKFNEYMYIFSCGGCFNSLLFHGYGHYGK